MVMTNFGGVGAIAGCHRSVLWLGGGIFLYIDNTKICCCYLGSMLVQFYFSF